MVLTPQQLKTKTPQSLQAPTINLSKDDLSLLSAVEWHDKQRYNYLIQHLQRLRMDWQNDAYCCVCSTLSTDNKHCCIPLISTLLEINSWDWEQKSRAYEPHASSAVVWIFSVNW
jgi:hypothetical protein